ncbi:peptide/nickel transport system ATP-binding protein/peptide/nickel transport system ATP-binding protein [Sinosporangium album]|uniref:Peptide/nickel transport system ATP-binding protein/peptide/nickel transport system ATP-binding protein n=1 Tax=Sinosporangium album TaxID=504805 RepID=A0A1G8I4Z8_9ACTN|nr:ABC transporter ATP-binding protein [Sinosporangium album]SDI13902.1 peptide/nickel transport system ATP-binding protein/peptide/nickel transport system ATP-binding protein [Sinosporangium album]
MIEIRDLVVRAGGRVISSVPELDLAAGRCTALVGESGSGKTTALLATLGLVEGAEVTGRVTVCGTEVLTASERALRDLRGAKAALVMQSPQAALNPVMRLGTLMRRALARHGVKGAAARARAHEAVSAVLLDPAVLRRYPHQVSGGQAQRFALALALALGADVIAADEPTSALDVTVQAEVVAVLRRLRDERGLALLLVSHDLALVSTVADDVVVMKDGRVVESGPTARVLTEPAHPYTRDLVAAVPRLKEVEL